MENGDERLTARNLHGDHLSLVTRGACSPEDGCGIGLNDSKDKNYVYTTEGKLQYTYPINITFSIDNNEPEAYENNQILIADLEKDILKEKIKMERLKLNKIKEGGNV